MNVTTRFYIPAIVSHSTGHLPVSSVYRKAHCQTMVTNLLLDTYLPADRGIALSGLFRQQCLLRAAYKGYRMVLHLLLPVFCSQTAACSLHIIGIPFHKWLRWPRTPFIGTGLTLAVLCIIVILYGSFVGRTRFEVKEATFTSSRLPQSFDGYRIVQLSDLHIGSFVGNGPAIKRLVDMVNAQHPDLIVLTGDLVNHRAVELDEFQDILAGLKAKDGVYSILGNHDYGPYFHWKDKQDQDANLVDLEQRQVAMGWKLLNNSHDFLIQGNDSIALIGVENEGEPPFSQHGDLPKAKADTDGMFQILLSHNPTHWRREVLPNSNIDLMLAGHTHAMQLQFGNYSPACYIYPEWGGMYLEGSRGLYVNVGIGYVGLPFRFGAWPEITVLTLRR